MRRPRDPVALGADGDCVRRTKAGIEIVEQALSVPGASLVVAGPIGAVWMIRQLSSPHTPSGERSR